MACSQTYEELFRGKTFTYFFERKNFSEANQYCINNYNGSLAVADDEDTLRALLPVKKSFPTGCEGNYFWIGLKKENGRRVWINKQQPSEFIKNVTTYLVSQTINCSCYAAEPLRENQNREKIKLKLGEVNCGTAVSFICEHERVTTSSKQPTTSIPAKVSTTLAETRRTIPSTPHRSSAKTSSVPNRNHALVQSIPTEIPSNVSPTVFVSPAITPTPLTNSQAGTSNSNMGVIIGSVVGVLAILAILLIFWLVWKCKSKNSQCGKNDKPVNDSDHSEDSVSSNPVVKPAYLAAGESSTAGGLFSEYLSVNERVVSATESDYDHLRRDVQDKEDLVAYAEINRNNKTKGEASFSKLPADIPATELDYDHLRRDVQDSEELVAYAEINRNNKTKSEASFPERSANIPHASRPESLQGKEICSSVNKPESLSMSGDSNTEIKDLYSTVNKPKLLTLDNDVKPSDVKDLYSTVQNKKK